MATNKFPLPILVADRAMCEFRSLWLAGLQPQLHLETSPDGHMHVSTRVAAVYSFPVWPNQHPHSPQYQQEHKTRPKTPSQIRRKEKRALARKARTLGSSAVHVEKATQSLNKAVQASLEISEAAMQTQPPVVSTTAAQTDLNCDDFLDPDENYQSTPTSQQPCLPILQSVQQQRPVVHDDIRSEVYSRKQELPHCHHPPAYFDKEREYHYEYLENERRKKELQLQQLSAKIKLGFKPVNARKPF